VRDICAQLGKKGLVKTVMIDVLARQQREGPPRQAAVAQSYLEQVASGSWQVFGAMLESQLVEGRQDYVPAARRLRPEHRCCCRRIRPSASRADGRGQQARGRR
jgi:phospho-2-dehydro-3-deoxyheptonate aldolase